MLDKMKRYIAIGECPVGEVKKSLSPLPPPDHVYGYSAKPDSAGVGVVTRSWMIHKPSPVPPQSKDYIKINKLSIKAGAYTTLKHKEFLKDLDIKKQFKYSMKNRYIDLPEDEFSYGIKNKPSTPIKNVINGIYGNKAANKLRKNYDSFFEDKSKVKKLVVKRTPHFKKLMESRKLNQQVKEEKEPYKMKMFSNIPSKLAQNLKFRNDRSRRRLNKNMSADNIFMEESKDKGIENNNNNANNMPKLPVVVSNVDLNKEEQKGQEIIA